MTVTKKKFMNLFMKKKKMTVTKNVNLFPLKKNIFFRGKRFMFFVTVIGFFHEFFPEEKKNDSYKKRESFSPEKKYFFQKNDSYPKIYTHFFDPQDQKKKIIKNKK